MTAGTGRMARAGAVATAIVAAALAGCRGATDGSAGASNGDALQHDLDAAAASAAFAPALRGNAPVRFVSALELGASPDAHQNAPATAPRGGASTRAPLPHAERELPPIVRVRVRYVDAPAPLTQVADAAPAPAPAEDAAGGAGTYTAPTEIAPVASGPVASGSAAGTGGGTGSGRRDHSGWGLIGGAILGAVIRGGSPGVDMCDPNERSGHRTHPRWPGERPNLRPAGGMITGTLHGELGGRATGSVYVPVSEIIRGASQPRARE